MPYKDHSVARMKENLSKIKAEVEERMDAHWWGTRPSEISPLEQPAVSLVHGVVLPKFYYYYFYSTCFLLLLLL